MVMIARTSGLIVNFTARTTGRRFASFNRPIYNFRVPKNKYARKMPGPMVWIDCEMTGLDHKEDRIIEICCLISDGQLELIDKASYQI